MASDEVEKKFDMLGAPVGEPLFGVWLSRRRDGHPGWYVFGRVFEWVGTKEEAEELIRSFDDGLFFNDVVAIAARPIAVDRIVETRDGRGRLVERRIFSDRVVTSGVEPRLVTVCSACLRASCWQDKFTCEQYRTAGTRRMRVDELLALGREDPSYWDDEPRSPR